MKRSEITLREAINMTEIFYPVKVVYDDIVLYDDYDSNEQFSPLIAIPVRMRGIENLIVADIHIEFVDLHHSIITLKGE